MEAGAPLNEGEVKEKKSIKVGRMCVAGGPGGISCTNYQNTEGVQLHNFPTNAAIRRQWVDFVRRYRPDFSPASKSMLCSVHFSDEAYTMNKDVAREVGLKLCLKTPIDAMLSII